MGIVKYPSLQYLDISHNYLQELPVWKENNLKILEASENELTAITMKSLDGLSDLEEIYLVENQIHRIDYQAFSSTPLLRLLDLSQNYVQKFLDVRIPNLQILRLSNNELAVQLTVKLEDLCPFLRILEIGSNKISYVDPAIFYGIFSLTLVDFSWNEFQCDCNMKPFIHWMEQNRDIIYGDITYGCSKLEDYLIPMSDVVEELECGSKDLPRDREMVS